MTMASGCLALLGDAGERNLYRGTLDPLEPVSAVGSGDAFLAGYVAARYEGRAHDQCLRLAVACGAESTGRLEAGLIDPREARRLMGDIELTSVELPAQVG